MRLLLAVVLLCSILRSQSQIPQKVAVQDSSATAQRKKEANEHQNSAKKPAPSLANETIKSTTEQSKTRNGTEQELEVNRRLAEYTGQLAVFTLLLVILGVLQFFALAVQARVLFHHGTLIKKSVQQMSQAVSAYEKYVGVAVESNTLTKEATALTRQSLILTQRPRLTVRAFIIDEPSQDDRRTSLNIKEEPFKGEEIKGRFSVVNSGSGRATVRASYCRILHAGPPEQLPMEYPYGKDAGGPIFRGVQELNAGQMIECQFTGPGPSMDQLAYAQQARINMVQSLHAYVLGWIDYDDDLGLSRRTAFCRHYDRARDRFSRVRNDPDYEHAD